MCRDGQSAPSAPLQCCLFAPDYSDNPGVTCQFQKGYCDTCPLPPGAFSAPRFPYCVFAHDVSLEQSCLCTTVTPKVPYLPQTPRPVAHAIHIASVYFLTRVGVCARLWATQRCRLRARRWGAQPLGAAARRRRRVSAGAVRSMSIRFGTAVRLFIQYPRRRSRRFNFVQQWHFPYHTSKR